MKNLINKQRKIDINELPKELPDFSSSFEPKDSLIKRWIINWILSSLSNKSIKENDILPKKSEISEYLGVSIGTVQNAIRYVEDEGFLKSKQKLGTMISNFTNPINSYVKSTSKRDKAVIAIKKVILQKEFKVGKPIPSTRKMSEYLGISQNTIRLAYEYLCSADILESLQMKGNDSNWYLKNIPTISNNELKHLENLSAQTIVLKLTTGIKSYLADNYKIGDKIPSHEELAKQFNVSVKTVHDSISQLIKERIIISRRGRYGSILAQDPLNPVYDTLKENSIFAKAEDAVFYSYQKTKVNLINYINNNFSAGDKLPSMTDLSKKFDVSTNTVRKALISLEQDGIVTFSRGRFGGTFIIEKPESAEKQQYQWLSINPEYI